ncbi:S1C family serine protease [Lawsonibacter sp.]|uniref:S1C family serine protease n=1 Tax=Lawsonibacter sp. TaxID=2185275 RepID=UPI002585AD99|nr:trypsin-like peptidase domain-containing protein [Lawsonibacter sp.]MBS1385208.1 PDZ domain-containing protein [Flavonifractor sp.]MCI6255896.1 trypsin-like peptidase domain-containing protein [Clostridiales bacterium]MDY2978249.1 trypsin-like peptidase domain-containing protein [Oscillospiraceae bacterium]MCI6398757.1 trypsin-like peptidase domain-containing protein [Lawsonibacter sp.]MDU2196579.1 trypsin-like peptidase domain-containing protein [Clostridiales bacterium]
MRNYYDQTAAWPPRRRGGRTAVVCFLIAIALLVGVAVLLRLLPAAELELPAGQDGDIRQPFAPAASEQPTTVERAPLGDGTTLELFPLPEGEPLRFQEIYQANLSCIVSVRGTKGSSMSLGTGVIMSENGYIITNSHVIEGCSAVDVVLWDERVYPALLVGRDEQTDLAVLKVECTGLSPADFGDSGLLRVGDVALAIGNPLGEDLRGTMTDGIISALNRDVNVDGRTMSLIQTTAALNSGNSGGALINEYGQVIGITNLKMQSYYDTVEGLGFAIPTATVKAVVDTLIETGVVTGRPTIGITAYTLTQAMAEAEGLPQGVCIKSVQAGSDAWRQGLRAGDVIVEANGVSIRTMDELQALKNGMQVGEVLSLRYCRENGWHTADVTLVDQYTLED